MKRIMMMNTDRSPVAFYGIDRIKNYCSLLGEGPVCSGLEAAAKPLLVSWVCKIRAQCLLTYAGS